MPLTPPNGGRIQYRLVGVPPGETFTPGTADPLPDTLFSVTSKRNADRPWIEGPPEGDGQSVDWLTGRVEDGSYSIRVIDEVDPDAAVAVSCDINDVLIPEGSSALHLDGTAFSSGMWTIEATGHPTTSKPAGHWNVNANGPILGTFALFGWTDPGEWVRGTAVTATIDGTEGGGQPFTPYQTVGFRFRVNWTLDTGPGNAFCAVSYRDWESEDGGFKIVSGLTSSFDFWTIPEDPLNNQVDHVVWTQASGDGEIKINLGAELMFPSFNLTVQFQDVEVVACEEVEVPLGQGVTSRYVTRWLADDYARQQMLGWQFYIEQSADEGVTWPEVLYVGYLTGLVLNESLVYEFTIGDTRKIERNTAAWRTIDVTDNTADAHPTALIGGPIFGGFLPYQVDRGLPVFEVTNQAAATANLNPNLPPDGWVELRYKSGPLPIEFHSPSSRDNRLAFHVIITSLSQGFFSPFETPSIAFSGTFPGLRAVLYAYTDGQAPAALQDLTPLCLGPSFGIHPLIDAFPAQRVLMNKSAEMVLRWGVTSTATYPNGTKFFVLLYPREISEDWPIHWQGHPVDFAKQMHDRHGLSYDSASATSVKAALGDDLAISLRPRDPNQTIQDALEQVYGRFGFAVRWNASGVREFFTFRQKADANPTLEITSNDIDLESGPAYEIGETEKVNRIVLRSKLFERWTDDSDEDRGHDGLVEHENEQPFDYSTDGGATVDADNYGALEQAYELPGHVAWAADYQPLNTLQFGDALARTVFEKYGRGVQSATWFVLRGTDGDDMPIGTEILNSVDHMPNAQLGQSPTSQRDGTRRMRVLQRTISPAGYELRVEDEDTSVAYDGTWSLAVADDLIAPLYFRRLTVTGSTELHADKAWLEIEVQLAGSAPSASTHGVQYTILDGQQMVDDVGAAVDPFTYRLGPFPQGQQVWVRGRAYYVGGGRSAWSTWTGTGGSAPAISGSISTLSTGTPVAAGTTISWTNTNTTHNVKVELKLDAVSSYSVIATLMPASTSFTIDGLTAGTDYDVRVTLVDASTGAEAGTALTGSFTTAASGTMTTLGTPSPVQGISGYNPITGVPAPGTYGLQVAAIFGPSAQIIVFEAAVETAIGSGTAGAYSEVARIPAVIGDWTTFIATAPDDSLLRYVRAYAEAEGYNDSGYTTVQAVDPWVTTVPTPVTTPSVGGMVPYYIGASESFTVSLYKQALFADPIVIDGDLIVEGRLIGVD